MNYKNYVVSPGGVLIDREISTTEQLKSSLSNMLKTPEARRFEELKRDGLDSETAAELSGLNAYGPQYRAEVMLGKLNSDVVVGAEAVTQTATSVVATGARQIGATAGSQIGAVMGGAILRTVTRNAATLSVGGVVIVGAGVAYGSGKLVAGSLGAAAGVACAVAALATTSLTALALFRRLR